MSDELKARMMKRIEGDNDDAVIFGALARIEELEEQLATWQSVFPDIAPRSVVPSTETMLKDTWNAAIDAAGAVAEDPFIEVPQVLAAIRALKRP